MTTAYYGFAFDVAVALDDDVAVSFMKLVPMLLLRLMILVVLLLMLLSLMMGLLLMVTMMVVMLLSMMLLTPMMGMNVHRHLWHSSWRPEPTTL